MYKFTFETERFIDIEREEALGQFPLFFVILTNREFYKIANKSTAFIGGF